MALLNFQRSEDARIFAESIVETIREPLIILDEDLTVVSANRAFYKQFQVEHSETEGKQIYNLGNNQWNIPKLRELLEIIIPANEKFGDFEVEHDFPVIGHRFMLLNARRLKQEGTKRSLILLAIEDVTEIVKTRRALEESEALYRRLVEEINSIIIDINSDGVITFVNRFVEKIFGYSREELVGKKLVGTILPETDREGTNNYGLIARVIRDPEQYYLNESVGLRKDGQEVWFSWSARSVKDPETGETTILVDGNDMTYVRNARRQARDARRIINATNSAIMSLDTGKNFLFINQAFANLTGKRIEEIEGISMDKAELPGNTKHQMAEIIDAAMQQQNEQIREVVFGEQCLLVRVEPVNETDQIDGVMVFASDITEWKKMENQLYQARKMESIGRLAGGIAHEFNNVLNVIHGNAELLRLRIEKNSPLLKYVHEIADTAQRSASLSDQLLTYSRQQQTGSPENIDLNREIKLRLNMLETLAGESIHIHFHPADSIWLVHIDPDELDQLLIVLMDNARDAIASSGDVTITTENIRLDQFSIAADLPPGNYVRMSFADNGSGMNRETRERIFDPFFTTKDVGRGTGLGLSTALGIIRQHNGSITVESEPGKGSTFHIYFPQYHRSRDE